MSASQQKKKRQGQTPAGSGKKPEGQSGGRGAWIAGGIGALLLILLAIFFGVVNSGFFQKHATAAIVGSHKLTPAMYNYFYLDAYYQSNAAYTADSSLSLSEQYYDEEAGVTWADYVEDQAESSIAKAYALYDAAAADGFTLSEADTETVETQLTNIEQSAASNSISADSYLSRIYGTGSTLKNFREYLELLQLANSYQTSYSESLSYSPEEIQAYFEEHEDTLSTVSYRYFQCSINSDETAEDGTAIIDSEASKALATEIAEAASNNEETFIQMAYENADESVQSYYEDESATLVSNQSLSSVPESMYDWLTDASRQFGDTTAVENSDGSWSAVFFIDNAEKYNVNTVDVRHILISSSDSDDPEAKAQEVLDEYLAGDQTEEAFAELAKKYSADSNAAEGGLYENVYPGQMVEAFEDWCFDPDRKPGDTGIVETSYGFHVMYFVGEGDGGNAMDYRTTLEMRSDDTEAWAASLAESVTVETKSFGMRFVSLK